MVGCLYAICDVIIIIKMDTTCIFTVVFYGCLFSQFFVFECILLANIRASKNGTTVNRGAYSILARGYQICIGRFPGENAKQLELDAISHFFLER